MISAVSGSLEVASRSIKEYIFSILLFSVKKERLSKFESFCFISKLCILSVEHVEALLNILLVDDEGDTKFLFESFFKTEIRNGAYSFSFATNGKEAIDLYEKERFDLILTDLNMPMMSGVELIKRVKELNPLQLIVILTAYDNKEHREFSESYQGITFFPKPVDFEELRGILKDFHENLINS